MKDFIYFFPTDRNNPTDIKDIKDCIRWVVSIRWAFFMKLFDENRPI